MVEVTVVAWLSALKGDLRGKGRTERSYREDGKLACPDAGQPGSTLLSGCRILRQFNRPEPKTFEDRSFMAEYDRPFSQSENDQREEFSEKMQLGMDRKPRPRLSWIWYRHPSVGGNRWSTRPPEWFPAKWKVRSERRMRLAGVGVPGGGGDRGKPWGRLANHAGAGR
eukprot:s6915_g2.t1